MAKTTQNDIKIDIIGFLRDLFGMVEKEENVTLEPSLLKSLEYIEKEYEKPYDQQNTKKIKQRGKSRSIVETIETVETKTQNVEEVTDKKGKGIEIEQ